MERGCIPSRWNSPPSSSGRQAEKSAVGRTEISKLEGNLTNISGMSESMKRAEFSLHNSSRSFISAPHSSQIDVLSLTPTNLDHDNYKRPNPFPLELGRRSEEAVTSEPDSLIFSKGSLVPPVPVGSPGALTLASLNLTADGLRQQIMLAGVNALAINNPAQRAQLLLGQNNALNANPSVISNNVPVLGGKLSTSVPDGLGLMKYRAPDISSLAFDRIVGYRFDPTTGLYYDANSGLFINLSLRIFLRWDPLLSTYLRVDLPGRSVSLGGVPVPDSTLDPGPSIPSIPGMLSSALPGPIQAPASAMNLSNLPPSSQDHFMTEIWQRMRALAKEVIGDPKVTQKAEEAVETSDLKRLPSDPDKGKHRGRSKSSSRSTSDSPSDESYSKERISKSKSRSGSCRKRSKGKSWSSKSPTRGLRRQSRSRRRSHSRGGRRSRSRSVTHKRRYRSRSRSRRRNRSRSRRRRRSHSRSLAHKRRRNRSRSRDIRRRCTSRSAGAGAFNGRWIKNHSPRRTSRSPAERSRRSRDSRFLDTTKRRNRDSPSREQKIIHRNNARSGQERAGSPDRHRGRKRIPEPGDTPVESKSEDAQKDDSDGLSDFEFLKETLDDDNESVIIDEYEEVLEYDYPPDNSAGSPTKPKTPQDPTIQDLGDVLGHLFPKNEGKYSNVIVSPIPLENDMSNSNALKSQVKNHPDICNVSVYHGRGCGLLYHFMIIFFKTIKAASRWYESHNGYLILRNEKGSQMKGYLHFTNRVSWPCEFCRFFNFPLRVLCRKCYQAKDKGFSPVKISKEPTKWVGMNKLKCSYLTVESVLRSLPSLEEYDVQNMRLVSEPSGLPMGLCVFEFKNVSDASRLGKFLTEQGRSWVYLLANQMPANMIDLNKIMDDGVLVGEVDDANNDPISNRTPELETDVTGSLNNFKGEEEDYLAQFFSDCTPSKTLLLAPIKFSEKPKALKSELISFETNLQTILNDDGVAYNQITLHIDKKVGAPFCYGLVDFPDAATADDWRVKHTGTLSISFAEQSAKVGLYFSIGNWSCWHCLSSNFPFRSICHRCFNHKEEGKSGPISYSPITTKWVATQNVLNWYLNDKSVAEGWKKYLHDFRLVRINVLRDPKFPALPLGCVFETEGLGDSLRLRELLIRIWKFAIFATTNPEFSAFAGSSSSDDTMMPKINASVESIHPAANSSSWGSEPHLLETQVQEAIPSKYLFWWGQGLTQFTDILNHLFLDNPLTRVIDSKSVFIGPLPVLLKLRAYCKIITRKLLQDNLPFTAITTHAGSTVGAPCNYGLVTFETSQDAKTFVNRFKDGLILFVDPTKGPKLKGQVETVNFENAFKTYLYLCKTNWRCSHCSAVNFGLRSICFKCLKGNDGSAAVLTFTHTPTNCICIRNFNLSASTEELLLAEHPSLKSRCTIKFLKEESGIPLGICLLETSDLDEAQKLFSDICENKKRRTRKDKDTFYGILNVNTSINISGGGVDYGKEGPCDNKPNENKADANNFRGSSNHESNAAARIDETHRHHPQSLSDVLDAAETKHGDSTIENLGAVATVKMDDPNPNESNVSNYGSLEDEPTLL